MTGTPSTPEIIASVRIVTFWKPCSIQVGVERLIRDPRKFEWVGSSRGAEEGVRASQRRRTTSKRRWA